MSRDTKIKDTKRVLSGFDYDNEVNLFYQGGGTESCIPLSRECIPFYADEACVESCQLLYDLNIQTFYSGANVDGNENQTSLANIVVSYDTLSEENKAIVHELIKQGIIGEIKNMDGRGQSNIFDISVPMKSDDLVGDISDKLLAISKMFIQQDVLYGRTTIEEIVKSYPLQEDGMYFDRWTFGTLSKEELAERIKDEVSSYFDGDDGYLYFTQDLCNKHMKYQESLKNSFNRK